MVADLVSIITPCYNGERYLDRYFSSLLEQTYPSVELIFVNDGSTDNTEKIALDYGRKLKERGYDFIYLYQENAGQSAAINKGLKIFKGEYLNWTDSDDYLTSDSVEKRVKFLVDNPEVGLVIGGTSLVDDVNYNQIDILDAFHSNRTSTREIIEDYLKGVFVNPCCSAMVRAPMFKEAMGYNLHIEEVREIGQNFQLFVPIMFNSPVRYIPEVVSYCVVHSDSHSHSRKTYDQKMKILDVAKKTLFSISDRLKINETERRWFRDKILEYDCKNRMDAMQHYKRRDRLEDVIKELKAIGAYDSSARRMALKIRYPIIKKLGDHLWRIRNK